MKDMIIDVREPLEYIRGHVEGAVNIPAGDIVRGVPKLEELQKDIRIVVYCNSGARSRQVAQILKSMGFVHVVNGINQKQVESALGTGQL
jgi:rhodanese-related sulfurtransferase